MKRFPLLFAVIVLVIFSSCQTETISNERTLDISETIEFRTPPDKVVVCHLNSEGEFEPKEVPLPALQGHLSHGDILPDVDGDGYTNAAACFGSKDDCDDTDASVHPGADEIPDDGIDQDCDGVDEVSLYCPCFSQQTLEDLYDVTWSWGWWSDVPGCKDVPYDQMLELWITNAGLPNDNFNFSAQAGTIDGAWFASSAIFNHETNQFDLLCGGFTSQTIAEPCRQILSNFIQDLRESHPDWDYCIRVP